MTMGIVVETYRTHTARTATYRLLCLICLKGVAVVAVQRILSKVMTELSEHAQGYPYEVQRDRLEIGHMDNFWDSNNKIPSQSRHDVPRQLAPPLASERMSQTLEAWQVLIRLQDEDKVKPNGVSSTYDVRTLELLEKATGRRFQMCRIGGTRAIDGTVRSAAPDVHPTSVIISPYSASTRRTQ
ncbi:predicted protein [Postia placenta Mad-698-R]|nr:predicted protein [Postia placenta Mad-698-R]